MGFRSAWKTDWASSSSAPASAQTKLVDLLVTKLEGYAHYLFEVGNSAEILSGVGSGAYPLETACRVHVCTLRE